MWIPKSNVYIFLAVSLVEGASQRLFAEESIQPLVAGSTNELVALKLSVAEYREKIVSIKAKNLYVRMSAAEQLCDSLLCEQSDKNPDYRYPADSHDLNREAGRAAHAIEELTEIRLPWITPRSTAADLDRVYREALHSMEVYRAGVRAAMTAKELCRPIKDVKEKYRGKIKSGVALEIIDFIKCDQAFVQFLHEWFPIGRTQKELEELIGQRATRIDEERNEFTFSIILGDPKEKVERLAVRYHFRLDKSGRIKCVAVAGS